MLSKLGKGNFKRKESGDKPAKGLPDPLPKKCKVSSTSANVDEAGVQQGGSSSSSSAPPAVETIRHVAAEIFLENKMSAVDVSRLARSSKHSGAQGIDDLASAGAHGTNPKNLARDLLSKLLKGTTVPPLFWHEVRGWDPVNKAQEMVSLPFLLPHEVIHSFSSRLETLKLDQAKYPEVAKLFHTKCRKLGLDPVSCLPLGFHGDGVPFSKKDSLELLSFNFLAEPHGERIPITGVSKSYVCSCGCLGKHTWDDVLAVSWSLRCLCTGRFPSTGPSGQPLDSARLKLQGKSLGFTALLTQIRAD